MSKNSGLTKILTAIGAVVAFLAAAAGAFALFKKYFSKKEDLDYVFTESFEDEEQPEEEAPTEE